MESKPKRFADALISTYFCLYLIGPIHIATITREVEGVKAESLAQLERLRVELSQTQLLNGTQFELELSAYREVWEILLAVHRAAAGLRPVWGRGLAQGGSRGRSSVAPAPHRSRGSTRRRPPTHASPTISPDGGSARSYTWPSQASGMSDLP